MFHVAQNIWNIDPGSDVINLTARAGLRDWTETELRPYQKPDFIDKYIAGDAALNARRRARANVLMVDFVGSDSSGAAWNQLSRPWIALNCAKFNLPSCPWN
ncbi:MAG: hypothetical protein FJW92_03250 [Actinobacteria bacterium]|nr:hypothetical protein [Actinomycetota bacterium]